MKKIIVVIIYLAYLNMTAQEYDTFHTKGYKSTYCGEEFFKFNFDGDFLIRTDMYYNSSIKIPSRRENTSYDNDGHYIEMWTPGFFLEKYGIDDYSNAKKFWYRLGYDKKGGSLLFILEFKELNGKLDLDNGKYYFTKLGYQIFCK